MRISLDKKQLVDFLREYYKGKNKVFDGQSDTGINDLRFVMKVLRGCNPKLECDAKGFILKVTFDYRPAVILGRKGGFKSAQNRFAGKTKQEISEMMRQIRQGKK